LTTKSKFFSLDTAKKTLHCRGQWTLSLLMRLKRDLHRLSISSDIVKIEGKSIETMDSAGALILTQWMKTFTRENRNLSLEDFQPQHLKLIQLVDIDEKEFILKRVKKEGPLAHVGRLTVEGGIEIQKFLSFIGEITLTVLSLFGRFKSFPWRSVIATIENTGVYALPLIGLLSFLIGVVLTYQMGLQLRNYGANIYIVDLLGLAILREFAPLMTAIIVAGRSGSAFAAQLGTMKIREEIDALKTMGLSPLKLLIIPKGVGLFFVLPLLAIWAAVFGIFGGMVVSNAMLHIGYKEFLERFYEVIPLKAYISGIIKAPVFGLIIAAIGCYQGMQVTGSATSVGNKTTTSVVQSIFFIIVADAAFSIIFKWFNL
jgi:phospholipid/cholesterol/gamma-HCH transport system permease protein